jgi:hypothetical protein
MSFGRSSRKKRRSIPAGRGGTLGMPGPGSGQSLRGRLGYWCAQRGLDRARGDHHGPADPPPPLSWFSDGWRGYQSILVRAYRQRKLTGKRGRPAWVVPATVTLTQTVKQRDEHGRLLSVEIRAVLGAEMEPAGTVHVERLNGALRDRLNALTRKTHAFAKRDATWDALVGLQFFDHNFHRAHRALQLPLAESVRRYQHRSPAMALGVNPRILRAELV